jgi:branched-chain amino acid transport system substrate-binding protein
MRKIIRFLSVLACLSTPAIADEEQDAIRLGATVPLSGDFATYGTLIRNGIDLAIEELEAEGKNVQITYEDVPYPGPKAVTAIRKLASTNKIHGLACIAHSTCA